MDWKFLLGLIGPIGAFLWSVYTWRTNQDAQRAQNEYQRKEQLYRELLRSVTVFYKGTSPPQDTGPFLEQYRLSWLYAPDDVVRALETFLRTQKQETPATQRDEMGQKALSELVAAIRNDLFGTVRIRTKLSASDFGHYS